jgi:hypothetical protein
VVAVKMKATDDKGVTRIELWADGVLYRKDEVGGGKTVDWQMDWTPPALGSYVLEAKALDTKFQSSPVARLEISVEQAEPPPTVPEPYGSIWAALGGMQSALGGPVGDPVSRFYAGQKFEHGYMFWRDNAGAADDWHYAIQWGPGDDQAAGTYWSRFVDDWQEGLDPEYSCVEATPPNGPVRGFGSVWCDRAEVRTALGAAIEQEAGTEGGWHDFEHGVMLRDAMNGRIFVLFSDGTWQAFPG